MTSSHFIVNYPNKPQLKISVKTLVVFLLPCMLSFFLGTKECFPVCWFNIVFYGKLHQWTFHCIRILTISVIFWFYIGDFKLQSVLQKISLVDTLPCLQSMKCISLINHDIRQSIIHFLIFLLCYAAEFIRWKWSLYNIQPDRYN